MAIITAASEIDALKVSPEFRGMTPAMRTWLLHFLENGDMQTATRAAYPLASPASQYSMAYQLKSNPSIQACIEVYRWASSKQSRLSLIALVKEQLAASEPGSVAAQRFASQLERLTLGNADQESDTDANPAPDPNLVEVDVKGPISKIGDVVLQDGQKYRVTAVNENGIATDGDPL